MALFTPYRVGSQLSGPAHRLIPRWAASVGCQRWRAQVAWPWGGRNWQGAEGIERGWELNTVLLLWALCLALSILSVSVFPTILPVLKMRLGEFK